MKWMAFGAALLATAVMQAPVTQAAVITFTTSLSGPNEEPPNASPGSGSAVVTIDDVAETMRIQFDFTGLIGTTTAAHIHCCTATPGAGTAGVATQVPFFVGFPIGVTSGSYDHTFDLTPAVVSDTYNPTFVTNNGGTVETAAAVLINGLEEGRAYLNIHSTAFPPGEIRGFLQQVPEPSSLLLLGAAFGGMLPFIRRRYSARRS
ncbi:MAG: CHRD domain-containing protein [Alphaproteobacteria bacterium]